MKPIRIISHTRCDEPGYLCEYLHRHDIKFENIGIEGDGTLPKGVDDISSLVILGSPYSVNDAHPWINDAATGVADRLGGDRGADFVWHGVRD